MAATGKEHLHGSAAAAENSFSSSLPPTLQHRLEAQFATDLSDVTIHEGHAATLIGAEAYGVGNDIHFAPGLYQPNSAAGQKLISHEIAHVVQQGASGSSAEVATDFIAANADSEGD